MKNYKTPVAEKVVFDYKDQVVASSTCQRIVGNEMPDGATTCIDDADYQTVEWIGNRSF